MGYRRNAMVIPAELTEWNVKDNPSNTNEGDLKEGVYLSVLIRVTIEEDGKTVQVFPKTEGDQSAIVEIPVDESGNTVATSSDNIKQFGWAAVPVSANLKAGMKYKYTLNYSKGVGLHDPEDPKPGTPIGGFNPQNVMVTITVQAWKDATAEYDPIVTVPYE